MKLLLTSFEPFGGSTINLTEKIVSVLAQESIPGVSLETAVLPVDYSASPEALIAAVQRSQPQAGQYTDNCPAPFRRRPPCPKLQINAG